MYALTFIHLLHIQLTQGADLFVLLVLLCQGKYLRFNLKPTLPVGLYRYSAFNVENSNPKHEVLYQV